MKKNKESNDHYEMRKNVMQFHLQHSTFIFDMAYGGKWLIVAVVGLMAVGASFSGCVFHFYSFLLWYIFDVCASQNDVRCTFCEIVHTLSLLHSPSHSIINCISFSLRESNIYCLLLFRVFILKFFYRLCPFYDPKRIPIAKWIVDCRWCHMFAVRFAMPCDNTHFNHDFRRMRFSI